jgi:acyl carrier protein
VDYKNSLMKYILDEFVRKRGGNITEDEDLLSSGLIDSLGILKLVSFIEEQFAMQIPSEDVVYENFHSIEAMSRYLTTREGDSPIR